MAYNSKIEWTDHTWNPWIGCTQVSPGCAFCYAMIMMARRYGRVEWGAGKARARTSKAYWRQPLWWNKCAELCRVIDGKVWDGSSKEQIAGQPETLTVNAKCGDEKRRIPISEWNAAQAYRPRVFCASLADWLDHEVPTQWRVDLLSLIEATPNLDWLLLTKRPQSWSARLHEAMGAGSKFAHRWLNGTVPANVWFGTTVEDQARASERIPHLLKIPARVRFLSCEPLLERVNLSGFLDDLSSVTPRRTPGDWVSYGIQWVICGGESGPGSRPMHPDWARSLRDQCKAASVPFFFKQWGEFLPLKVAEHPITVTKLTIKGRKHTRFHDWHDGHVSIPVGKQFAGRGLDDRTHEEFPAFDHPALKGRDPLTA